MGNRDRSMGKGSGKNTKGRNNTNGNSGGKGEQPVGKSTNPRKGNKVKILHGLALRNPDSSLLTQLQAQQDECKRLGDFRELYASAVSALQLSLQKAKSLHSVNFEAGTISWMATMDRLVEAAISSGCFPADIQRVNVKQASIEIVFVVRSSVYLGQILDHMATKPTVRKGSPYLINYRSDVNTAAMPNFSKGGKKDSNKGHYKGSSKTGKGPNTYAAAARGANTIPLDLPISGQLSGSDKGDNKTSATVNRPQQNTDSNTGKTGTGSVYTAVASVGGEKYRSAAVKKFMSPEKIINQASQRSIGTTPDVNNGSQEIYMYDVDTGNSDMRDGDSQPTDTSTYKSNGVSEVQIAEAKSTSRIATTKNCSKSSKSVDEGFLKVEDGSENSSLNDSDSDTSYYSDRNSRSASKNDDSNEMDISNMDTSNMDATMSTATTTPSGKYVAGDKKAKTVTMVEKPKKAGKNKTKSTTVKKT